MSVSTHIYIDHGLSGDAIESVAATLDRFWESLGGRFWLFDDLDALYPNGVFDGRWRFTPYSGNTTVMEEMEEFDHAFLSGPDVFNGTIFEKVQSFNPPARWFTFLCSADVRQRVCRFAEKAAGYFESSVYLVCSDYIGAANVAFEGGALQDMLDNLHGRPLREDEFYPCKRPLPDESSSRYLVKVVDYRA